VGSVSYDCQIADFGADIFSSQNYVAVRELQIRLDIGMGKTATSSCPTRLVVVAGAGELHDKSNLLLSPWHGQRLLGQLLALSRRRGEELTQV
jgi:hypothetical protein